MPPTATDVAEPRSVPRGTDTGRELLGRGAALLALGLVVVGFLVAVAGDLDAPFGDSYEGRNGGVWGAGSQALREEGPLASALGARHESGLVYARHPPLIYPLTAASEWLGDPGEIAVRAPSVLAAVATLVLLYVLLRTVGLHRLSALLGVAVVSGTAMVTVYGPMPDTPMLGLPVGLALVIAWLRRRQDRALPRGVELALATVAALTAWQAVFVALLVAAAEAVRAVPGHRGPAPRRRLHAAWPFLVGTALGLALTLAWVVWATGGPGHLVDALTERSGAEGGVDGAGIVSAQLSALVDLFGIAVLGLLATVVAVRTDRFRAVCLMLLVAVFGYAALTPTAAGAHDYWLYWALAPVALGWAIAVERALEVDRGREDRLFVAGTVLVALVVMVLGRTTESAAGRAVEAGYPAGALVADVDLPEGQEEIVTVGVINQYAAWIPLASGADTAGLADRAELADLAATSPDHVLLASTLCPAVDDGLCVPVTGGGGTRVDHDYLLLTAAEAQRRVAG